MHLTRNDNSLRASSRNRCYRRYWNVSLSKGNVLPNRCCALSSAGTWLTIGVGRSCWFGSRVRWTRFLLIVLVGVSTLYDRGVDAASNTFPDRWRSLTKTSVPGPIEGKGLALCLVLNTVSCFNLLMLSHAHRLSKSGHSGFSWVWNNGMLESYQSNSKSLNFWCVWELRSGTWGLWSVSSHWFSHNVLPGSFTSPCER